MKVLTAGICNTDVEISRGYMQFRGIIGHEFVGVVESSPYPSQVGTRIVGEINAGCEKCPTCRALAETLPERTTLGIFGRDGAMAEYLTLLRPTCCRSRAASPMTRRFLLNPLLRLWRFSNRSK